MLKKFSIGLAAGISALAIQGAAFAADVVPAPKPAAKNNTISLEFSPEYDASAANAGWKDDYLKAAISHTFDNNFVVGAAYQHTWRSTSTAEQIEATIGYKIKNGPFTLTPSVLLGYGFGDQPKINPASGHATDPETYYAVSLAADYKIDDNWTWNVFNARYRNAFDVTWITPKVSTGITYKFNSSSAVYANVGYGWKDSGNGAGLQADKWNVAIGYKFSF
jgi:predicted porin